MPALDVTPEPEVDGREAADQAALDRADQGGILDGDQGTPEPSARPEWCPEKYARFNDDGSFNASAAAEEMAKGMDHLNKMATQNRQADADDDNVTAADDDATGDEPTPEGDSEPLTTPELWQSFTDEYGETGELSAESRKIISDLGIPEAMVDDYIAGQQARAGEWQQSATSVLGNNGDAEYEALVDWADNGNMSDAQAEAFNDAVTSGDLSRAQMAIRDLKNMYVAAEGSYDGLALQGGNATQTGTVPFGSRHEMTTAINDPRYAKDSAYRAEVERRIGATPL